jgi:hypothetical protein
VPRDEVRVTTKSGRLLRDDPGLPMPTRFHETRVPAPVTDPSRHLVDYTAQGAARSYDESLGRAWPRAALPIYRRPSFYYISLVFLRTK